MRSRLARALLDAVRIRDPRRVYDLYPHEVSGGMGQRVISQRLKLRAAVAETVGMASR